MHLLEGADLARSGCPGTAIHELYAKIGQEVYAINVKRSNDLYADYYFDGEEELQFLYRCAGMPSKEAFLHAYTGVTRFMSETRCLDDKDARLDHLVIARAYANKALTGCFIKDLDEITHESIPLIATGFETNFTGQSFENIDNIGFYPIVSDANWFELLASWGAKTIQLRVKDDSEYKVEKMVSACSEIASKYGIRLIVNDYWQIAQKYDVYGIHLGQEDIKTANLDLVRKSGMRLGISTHCYHELARAMFYGPSYVALGAIYDTTTKSMRFRAQGIVLLRRWGKLTSSCPVVAIGGITLSNLDTVKSSGAAGVAVISAISQAVDPGSAAREFIRVIERRK